MVRANVKHTYTQKQKLFLRFLKENDDLKHFIKLTNEPIYLRERVKRLHPINKLFTTYSIGTIIEWYYYFHCNNYCSKYQKCLDFIEKKW